MAKKHKVTIHEGIFDLDYRETMTLFSTRLIADISGCKTGLRIVPAGRQREDGPRYQMQVISDGDQILFCFEGDNEEECAESLWAALCLKYQLVEKEMAAGEKVH